MGQMSSSPLRLDPGSSGEESIMPGEGTGCRVSWSFLRSVGLRKGSRAPQAVCGGIHALWGPGVGVNSSQDRAPTPYWARMRGSIGELCY